MRTRAHAVLVEEAQGLLALADNLPETFEEAVSILLAQKGKTVFSGMGKSGHVGKKIAATFCSIGMPAFFLHPGEAVHGDLGALSKDDVLILLSNSAETIELRGLLRHASFLDIPCLLITSCKEGSLAKQASLVLSLPKVPEACSLGLSPTTSACMMMGLGDALAMALLDANKFSTHDYRRLHQGGQLGHQLCSLSEIMHTSTQLPLVNDDCLMEKAILEMSQKGFGCVGVINAEGALIGIISEGDLRRHMAPNLLTRPVIEVMTSSPKTAKKDMLLQEALLFMNEKNITVLFVVDDTFRPEGLVHMHDCLRGTRP